MLPLSGTKTKRTALRARPTTLREANAYVEELHRHSKPVRGQKFSFGAELNGRLVGVVIVGRPTARMLQDGLTAEVLRVCTDGTRNVPSFLYSRAWQAARAMGYTRVVTYTLQSETGASLRASGWRCVAEVAPANWNRPSRTRDPQHHPVAPRFRWEVTSPEASDRPEEFSSSH
jgi:hypothetical protein